MKIAEGLRDRFRVLARMLDVISDWLAIDTDVDRDIIAAQPVVDRLTGRSLM